MKWDFYWPLKAKDWLSDCFNKLSGQRYVVQGAAK